MILNKRIQNDHITIQSHEKKCSYLIAPKSFFIVNCLWLANLKYKMMEFHIDANEYYQTVHLNNLRLFTRKKETSTDLKMYVRPINIDTEVSQA